MALFLASLGNPPPYLKTRHSIAHLVLRALAAELQPSSVQNALPAPPSRMPRNVLTPSYLQYLTNPVASKVIFDSSQTREAVVLPRTETPVTCYQTSSYMNTCGPNIVRRWKSWMQSWNQTAQYRWDSKRMQDSTAASHPTSASAAGQNTVIDGFPLNASQSCNLIVLHDDLELKPGKLNVRRGDLRLSSRGNNGLKSLVATLQKKEHLEMIQNKMPGASNESSKPSSLSLTRIGIGIGRPQSRDPTEVADYVLAELSEEEIMTALGLIGHLVEILDDEVLRIHQDIPPNS